MGKLRIIPTIQLKNRNAVKTRQFRTPQYIGDPLEVIGSFNEGGIDELIILDIQATVQKRKPDFEFIAGLVGRCAGLVMYGGGIHALEDIENVLDAGAKKVILGTCAVENDQLVREAAERFGSRRIVVSVDVKKNFFGKYEVCTHSGIVATRLHPVEHAVHMERAACGEILLNSIDRDGTREGCDLALIRQVADAVAVPVIACGGAGNPSDIIEAFAMSGASAIAAGSMFFYDEKRSTVSLSFPASLHGLHI